MTEAARLSTLFRPLPGLRAVVAGVGCVGEQLSAELDRQGIERPLLLCGESVARSQTLALVQNALGRPATLYTGSRPHTPGDAVEASAALARAARADAIIAVGGSAAVDCAKGAAVLLQLGLERIAQLEPLDFSNLFEHRPAGHAPLPLVAITTTLSFAEFLPFFGARDAGARRKRPYADHGCVERTIFLDGVLAAQTPDQPWLETGIKALDDAISAYCRASGPEPFLDPFLERAIADLVEWLPRSRAGAAIDRAATADPAARQRVLTACWMTKTPTPTFTPPAFRAWLSTALRHSLGAVCETRHGAASCVGLPEALRFHAEATRERQRRLALRLGWPAEGAVPLGAGLDALLEELGVPTRLAELGVAGDRLEEVAQAVFEEAPTLGDRHAIRAACERIAGD
ncbi:iron-containing alcohol dehydrogenase [Myxococcota bacterium]|nr:iron-containing alcohol dehydrogenase [Myxococcota bacterium]